MEDPLASTIQEASAADMANPMMRSEGKILKPSAPQTSTVGAPSTVVAAGIETTDLGRTCALVSCNTLLRHRALTDAQAALDRLGADLRDVVVCLAKERLKLVAGWYQLDAASKVSQCQTEAAITQSEKETAEAKAARESTLAEAEAAIKRRAEVEASLKADQDEQVADARRLQLREDDLKAHEARLGPASRT